MLSRNQFYPRRYYLNHMYDPSKKQFVYCDDDTDEEFVFDIKPRFVNIVSAIMSSSAPFAVVEKFIIMYARTRIWVYDAQSLSSFRLIPERFVPYINIERIGVTLSDEYVCVYEGCNILIVGAYGQFVLSDVDTALYRLPPYFKVLDSALYSHSDENQSANVLNICAYDELHRRYYYGTILTERYFEYRMIPTRKIKTIRWNRLPKGEYTVRDGVYRQMVDGVETSIVPGSYHINIPTETIE